jgi:DNA repair protein RecN (Recombination protein N)
MLENAEDLFTFASEAEGILHGSDASEATPVLDSLNSLLNRVRPLSAVDAKLNDAMEHLNNLKLHAEELSYFLRAYSQSVSHDESRLEEQNARIALLTKLKRKYGPTLADVIENLEVYRKELSLLENHDSSLSEAKDAMEAALARLRAESLQLSKLRQKAGKEFAKAVVGELADLHMERARFMVSFQELAEPNFSGIDSVRFEIAANPGEPVGPLNKVASGGELSRIMLAMHNVVSSRGEVGVYLFDEVDTGIGGKTAVTVGAKLQKVARDNQVICITHLPQVAAFADLHFHVEKSVKKKDGEERTIAKVLALTTAEREMELARMLGGHDKDKASLANAKAMLEKASAGRAKAKAAIKPAARPMAKTKAGEKRVN